MRRAQFLETRTKAGRAGRFLAWFGLFAALGAVAVARAGRITPAETLAVLCAGWAVSLAALALSAAGVVTVWREGARGGLAAVTGLVVSVLSLLWPAVAALQLWRAPGEADIVTDAADPPAFSPGFVTVSPPRPAGAGGEPGHGLALPLFLEKSPAAAAADAAAAARALGWRTGPVIAGAGGAASFEAAARGDILGMPQYVAVRVRPTADGAQLDVRVADPYGFLVPGSGRRRIQELQEAVRELAG
ncbi:hypothetical protein ACFFJB_09310 [Camelimonas abortus]|uniref:DUF1499 domain-containing protein n=1 Tax=Camelimonas abortus TaxID=1017184 RepID=A0ABV7LDH7_9HYPH